MSVAFGPWGVGDRTAHYVILLVSYRYNVNTGIRRYNAHNFGHTWLHFIDRIQSRILNISLVLTSPMPHGAGILSSVKDFVARNGDNGARIGHSVILISLGIYF